MNAKTMSAILEHIDAKSERIYDLAALAATRLNDLAELQIKEANQAMQGDITMHRAVLSRILMEKGASQLLHGMEWNDAARKVLFEAGAMVGDTGKPSA